MTDSLKSILCACIVMLAASVAPADEATATFKELFGQRLRDVIATSGPNDDVALAADLLAAARTAKSEPALATLLCDNAYTLGSRTVEGYDTALAAMALLAEVVPDKREQADDKSVVLLRRWMARAKGDDREMVGRRLVDALVAIGDQKVADGDYGAAVVAYRQAYSYANVVDHPDKDRIKALLDTATNREKVARRVILLNQRLEADATDHAARAELIRLYVVDLDAPQRAVIFAGASDDEALRRFVPLATRPVESLAEADLLAMGGWYRDLAGSAVAGSELAMLTRARTYLDAYLQKHSTQDLERVKGALALKQVTESQAKIAPSAPAPAASSSSPASPLSGKSSTTATSAAAIQPGKPVDVLAMVDTTRHRRSGDWGRAGARVAANVESPFSGASVTVPVVPKGDYELEIKFTRDIGRPIVKIYVPLNGFRGMCLALGVDDGRIGAIENGIGRIFYKNTQGSPYTGIEPVSQAVRFQTGAGYVANIRVQTVDDTPQITVKMNGKPYLMWKGTKGSARRSSLVSTVGVLGQPALGVFTPVNKSAAVFHAVTLKMLNGEAEVKP